MSNNFSVFHGIAVEDRAMASREIKVFIRELVPYGAGEIGDNTRNESYSVKTDTGDSISGNVSTTNCVVADYFGGETNRFHPPDIVRGEQVIVTKYADEDRYYWQSTGRDDNLRRGELIRFAASNDMAQSKQLNEANTYFIEMDTKLANRIRLHTSKSNGEAYGYDLIIDARNNFVQLTDDVGNKIEIHSDTTFITITNKDGATVNLDKEDIAIMAPSNITIRAGKLLTLTAAEIITNAPMSRSGSIGSISGV